MRAPLRSAGAAYPPPPGGSMRTLSPGARALLAVLENSSSACGVPKLRMSRARRPSPPPSTPAATPTVWLSDRAENTMPGPTARICFAIASPPRVRPTPPESGIIAYSSISSGYSFSSASTGRLDVLVMCTCTASIPSASNRAPAPPPSVSRYTKCPARSRQRPENTMAGQQSLLDALVFSGGS
ncbi:hypothetical protein G6F31_018944 [Rhizopus arrhizus]|nr:hypothetical protein G6F31_018944 [Rhizopus arrhizus]